MVQAYSWPALTIGEPEDMASLRERARQEGYEDGYQAGHKSAQQEAAELRHSLGESLTRVATLERTLEAEDQQELLQLIHKLTHALIGVELRTNPLVIEAFVAEAVEKLNTERSELVLYISADDENWLSDLPGVRMVVAPSQAPGTFSLCNNRASIELDAAHRLAELLEAAGATVEN